MFTYAKIALALLQLADVLVALARSRQQMQAGADAEIAKASASILLKCQSAQEVMGRVVAMSQAEVDQSLKELEPK
jgi:hypothetical protein